MKQRFYSGRKNSATKALLALAVAGAMIIDTGPAWARTCDDKLEDCKKESAQEFSECEERANAEKDSAEMRCSGDFFNCHWTTCNGDDKCASDNCQPARRSCNQEANRDYLREVGICSQRQSDSDSDCFQQWLNCS
jgi:hypothetical protein